MEMISQGWPLFAAVIGTGRVYAVVGWERPEGAAGFTPISVEITRGGDSRPYALDPGSDQVGGAEIVFGTSEATMRFTAGGKPEVRRDK